MSKKSFNYVSGLRPGRSVFDLSYEKKFTCDMGQLIPVMCDEVVPGDKFILGNRSVIRFQPLVAPVLHEINVYVHYFFVPYRILWNEKTNDETEDTGTWEEFITGGSDGDQTPAIPRWNPGAGETDNGTLWDFLGFPVGIDPDYAWPIDFPRRAYNMIYNEYYRDENLIDPKDIDGTVILNRCWSKDYFTSALPFQQKGTGPSLPIAGSSQAEWDAADIIATTSSGSYIWGTDPTNTQTDVLFAGSGGTGAAKTQAENFFDNNTVDLSVATTFDIADLRTAFQIQKWMERNARAGNRYTEFLGAHFGVAPRDERLQRPEYIGGCKTPVLLSEVLQTSSTDATTPQGNLAGHGIAVSNDYCGKYSSDEFGLIMGIMSIMPLPQYQQGINRQWIKSTKYEFYFPEFANMSEQEIYQAEIMAIDSPGDYSNLATFGYQGRYDEMRTKNNLTCSKMRDDFDYWHLGRIFSVGSPPSLNESFVQCDPTKRIFAAEDEPGLIVSCGNIIKAIRPIPIAAEPGLIDHH